VAARRPAARCRAGLANRGARSVCVSQPALRHAPAAGRGAGPGPRRRPLAHPPRVKGARPAGPAAALVRAAYDRRRPGRARRPQPLARPAGPYRPNRAWVGDITYLPRQGGGWLYLAVWLDRCSRKIVGWDVRDTMPEDLVSEALRRALVVRRPPAGLVVHSDQGSQYTATRFKALVARHGAQQSMSRRGNCYDNAHAESFWSRFKAELLDGGSFPGLTEAKLEISHHIAYYNAERRHSSLGYQAPNHFETQLKTTSQLCPA